MPQPRKSPTTTAAPSGAPKVFARRVRSAAVGYVTRRPGPTGAVVEVPNDAAFGDEVMLDALEQIRLDSIGALAPEGATREDCHAELQAQIERYRSARRGVEGLI